MVSTSTKPTALFVFGAFRREGGGLSRVWYQRLQSMHDSGWDVRVAFFVYRRYRNKGLEVVLGGAIPKGVTVYRFWDAPVNHVAAFTKFLGDGFKFALRRLMRKPLRSIVVEQRADGMQHEWKYDRFERLMTEVDRNVETQQARFLVRYDTAGKWILREWLGIDEEDVTQVQRATDPEPISIHDARLEWLNSLNLPDGTVVMSDSPHSYPVIAQLPNRFGKVFVMHLNHLARGEGPLGNLTPRMNVSLELYHDAPDAVTVATPEQAEDLKIRYGQDFPAYVIRPVVRKVPTPPNIVRDPFRVVALGRIVDVKRLHLAFQAIGKVREVVPQAYLEVWGSGNDRERLETVLDELNLRDCVTFKGYTSTPEQVFRGAGLSIMTSRRESFGLAVIESILQGCPVVSFDVKYGPRRVIEDGVNGFIVPDNDVAGMAQRIIEIMQNPVLHERMIVEAEKFEAQVDHTHFQRAWNELGHDVRAKALKRAQHNAG